MYRRSLSLFVHVDADGNRPSSLEESMLRLHERREPSYGEHMAGAYPQVGLPHGSECRCDVTLERITLL